MRVPEEYREDLQRLRRFEASRLGGVLIVLFSAASVFSALSYVHDAGLI